MPSSLGAIASTVMIGASLALLWSARAHQHSRTYMLLASAWLLSGLAWFLPSETARALFLVAAAALSVPVVIALMIRTWRQASVHE